jgi:aspartate/tyrosine/aromatic aminotransferase
MFESLTPAPPDPILGLSEAFRGDPNPNKIDLSVGVYRDEHGTTPMFACVREAARRLAESETTKSYLPIDGLPEFGKRVRELLFGGADSKLATDGRAVTAQTPGGTAALRVAADFVRRSFHSARVWYSRPTWNNHPAVFAAAGLEGVEYPYIDAAGTGLDFPAMIGALRGATRGDLVCLHASCHNPTGIDPTPEQWNEIARVVAERGLLPLVDFAYQGLGDSLKGDGVGLDALCRTGCDLLVASSYSKNFGLYGERVGALTIVAGTSEAARAAMSHVKVCVRVNYSNPPKHGGQLVATVLADAELRRQWEAELETMRQRIHGMRTLFVETMRRKAPGRDFGFLTRQKGMFSYSGLTRDEVERLRREHSVYIVGSGRINVAGITEKNIDRLCDAIAAVIA